MEQLVRPCTKHRFTKCFFITSKLTRADLDNPEKLSKKHEIRKDFRPCEIECSNVKLQTARRSTQVIEFLQNVFGKMRGPHDIYAFSITKPNNNFGNVANFS